MTRNGTRDGEAAWLGQFTSETCVPRLHFPSVGTGVWKAAIVGADQGHPRVFVESTTAPAPTLTFFTTP
jgi:hypothetical protein